MDSGPLPPHERTWRHPSELGPTKYDVDAGPTSHIATLAAGTLAVFAVAAIVVAMTPRPTSSPLAVSATTTPRSASTVVATPVGTPVGSPASIPAFTALQSPAARRSSSTVLFTTFASYPHSILATPQPNLESVGVATEEPDDDDIVSLRTEAVTYRLPWELVALIDVPDGSVVFDGNGDVVARVYGGDVLSVVGG